ncbi:CoA ester lyase [Mycobacterium sp.]|uniref:HpcH/HpaI aldolase/citrate lyase family protein n=1 Tax=Mycobacterium sp. TaxID=1785 RepID=UPI000CB828DE|nr:CoA ester lyase [Mycobacterium sp.]PJE06020.1 MAG: CoA ester lyase [Mycobacterium sp.]
MPTPANPRSLLFVPGDRPERFAKAAASGADGIVLDLEDAVASVNKAQARHHVAAWLADSKSMVRINAADTEWFDGDVALVQSTHCPVMVPKVQSAAQIAAIVRHLPNVPVTVLLETASGIVHSAEICAVPGVTGVAFGSVDLGAELGVDPADRQSMAQARGALVLAAAANQLPPPLDGVCVDLENDDVVAAEAKYAARLGFGGKLCIHPRQVISINGAFTPTVEDVAWAQRVVGADEGNGTAVVDGKMIDRPVLIRASRILQRADRR